MRVLVLSDTHRDRYALREALLRQPKAEVLIHLGTARERRRSFARAAGKAFYQVRGNCDWGSLLPLWGSFAWRAGIFFTRMGIFMR